MESPFSRPAPPPLPEPELDLPDIVDDFPVRTLKAKGKRKPIRNIYKHIFLGLCILVVLVILVAIGWLIAYSAGNSGSSVKYIKFNSSSGTNSAPTPTPSPNDQVD